MNKCENTIIIIITNNLALYNYYKLIILSPGILGFEMEKNNIKLKI